MNVAGAFQVGGGNGQVDQIRERQLVGHDFEAVQIFPSSFGMRVGLRSLIIYVTICQQL